MRGGAHQSAPSRVGALGTAPAMNATRATLLDRLRDASDPLVWTEFFERYWRLIYTCGRRLGASAETAEEVVQDVMLTMYGGQVVFRYDPSKGRFRDWLAGIVRHHLGRRRRQPAERIRGAGGDATGPEPPAAAVPVDWDAAFEQSLLSVLLNTVRREVSPQTYQAFELATLHEMSGAEVARLTGLTRNAVYLACKRVLERLKELGATYRRDGQLSARLKRALQEPPPPVSEPMLARRVEQTLQSSPPMPI